MRKVFFKLLAGVFCFSLTLPMFATNSYANELESLDDTVEAVSDNEVSENDVDLSELLDEPEGDLGNAFDKEKEFSGIVIDGVEYEGNVWVKLSTDSDGEAIKSGTRFTVILENMHENFKKEVSLTTDNNFGAEVSVPVGEYYVTTYASVDGKNSNASLSFTSGDDNGYITLYENGQVLKFKLKGDVTVEEEPKEPVKEEVETKQEENFWLRLLKNNLIFLVLLAGAGIALLVIRLKQDNQ